MLWYGSRIYADWQQKFFSLEHDFGARILLVTFLAEQKREYDTQSLYFFVNVQSTSLMKKSVPPFLKALHKYVELLKYKLSEFKESPQ